MNFRPSFPIQSNPIPAHSISQPYINNFSSPRQSQILISGRKLQHINCILEKTNNLGGLYLGDIICTLKPQIMQQNRIQAIVSCIGDEAMPKEMHKNGIEIKHIKAHDSLDYPIELHFYECFQFIEDMRRLRKNVLVHCHAGVSRSSTIVCAYIMMKEKKNPQQVLTFVRSKRQRAKPNLNFWNQLVNLYSRIEKIQKQRTYKERNISNKQSALKIQQTSQTIPKVSGQSPKIEDSEQKIETAEYFTKLSSELHSKAASFISSILGTSQKQNRSANISQPQKTKQRKYQSQAFGFSSTNSGMHVSHKPAQIINQMHKSQCVVLGGDTKHQKLVVTDKKKRIPFQNKLTDKNQEAILHDKNKNKAKQKSKNNVQQKNITSPRKLFGSSQSPQNSNYLKVDNKQKVQFNKIGCPNSNIRKKVSFYSPSHANSNYKPNSNQIYRSSILKNPVSLNFMKSNSGIFNQMSSSIRLSCSPFVNRSQQTSQMSFAIKSPLHVSSIYMNHQ